MRKFISFGCATSCFSREVFAVDANLKCLFPSAQKRIYDGAAGGVSTREAESDC